MREGVRLGVEVGESASYSKIVSNIIQPSHEQINDDTLLIVNISIKSNLIFINYLIFLIIIL